MAGIHSLPAVVEVGSKGPVLVGAVVGAVVGEVEMTLDRRDSGVLVRDHVVVLVTGPGELYLSVGDSLRVLA